MTIPELILQIVGGTPLRISLPSDTIDLVVISYVPEGMLFEVITEDSPIYVLNPINSHRRMTEAELVAWLQGWPELWIRS